MTTEFEINSVYTTVTSTFAPKFLDFSLKMRK